MHQMEDYFKRKRGRDSPSDSHNALLAIAVLITTATFQVGLPQIDQHQHIWQEIRFWVLTAQKYFLLVRFSIPLDFQYHFT